MSPQQAFAQAAREGGRAALVTVVASEPGGGDVRVGARMLVSSEGDVLGSLGDPDLDRVATGHAEDLMWGERSEAFDEHGVTLFVDVVHPPPRLIVFGAVDFAAELCRMARAAGWHPYLVDPRSRFATPERFPDAEEVIVGWPGEAFVRLGGIDRATYIAVLTHDPKLDDAALTIALESDAPYVGAMGSRRAQADRRERLLAGGVPEETLERISAPIGLDLGGLTAEETALSIMAEVVAVRNGREGGRLTHAAGRIHDVGV